MADIKLTLKMGVLEVTYEGSESFASESLVDIMLRVVDLDLPKVEPVVVVREGESVASTPAVSKIESGAKLSTTDFAVKMGVKSGSDLAMAAAAHLHLTKGMEDFRRADILNEMKGAKAFYKMTYSSNLSKSLEMLTKSGRIQNPRTDAYSLPYSEVQSMKRHLP